MPTWEKRALCRDKVHVYENRRLGGRPGAFIDHTRATKRGFLVLACIGHGFICHLIRRPLSHFPMEMKRPLHLHIISGPRGCDLRGSHVQSWQAWAVCPINVLWARPWCRHSGRCSTRPRLLRALLRRLCLALFTGLSTPLLALGWCFVLYARRPREAAGSPLDRSCFRVCSMV